MRSATAISVTTRLSSLEELVRNLSDRIDALEQKQAADIQTLAADLTDIYEQQVKKADLEDIRGIVSILNERTAEITDVLASVDPIEPKPEPIRARTADSTTRRSPSPGLPLRSVKARVVDKSL